MKTILVPVDLSAATPRVVEAARTLARGIQARLVLMHVVVPQPIFMGDAYAFNAAAVADATESERREATQKLEELAKSAAGAELPARTVQVTGTPEVEILAQAAAVQADYIVIGSHGHGVAYDLLIGSAVQGVLRKAQCPVLVVPVKGT